MRSQPPDPGPSLFVADRRGSGDNRSTTATGTEVALQYLWGSVITAVRTFTHPGTGRTVTLVGTMHIGEHRYFRELSAVVEGLATTGAEIHVEGITHRRDDSLSDMERDHLAQADRWADPETTGAAVSVLRAESQGVRLRLPDDVRNIDLSELELLRRIGWDNYRRLFAPPPTERSTPGLGPVARTVIRFHFRHRRALDRLKSLRRRNRQVHQVVIEERNRVAFAGGTDALTSGDVVLVWGADHLPGLAALFRAAGYRLRREEWFEACTI